MYKKERESIHVYTVNTHDYYMEKDLWVGDFFSAEQSLP